jgi:hypothetical protein
MIGTGVVHQPLACFQAALETFVAQVERVS